jgi:1,4-alpha-glucan branching enzyme
MGGEFGQFDEWSEYRSINWFLLDQYEHHRQMHKFVKTLNNLYIKEKAFWMGDFWQDGFQWINADDAERSIYSFVRMGTKQRRSLADQRKLGPYREYLVFICNFTPVPDLNFRVGVPDNIKYKEILNSDDTKYGGSGITNPGTLNAEEFFCDGRQYSVQLKLPPLGCVVLKGRTD